MAWVENVVFESEDFRLDVPRWDFPNDGITCVLGESGSGKTTLLQILAGLVPGNPKISLHGELVSDLPPQSRNFGFVFQDHGLFPHLTTFENIAFAAQAKNLPDVMWRDNGEKLMDRLKLQKVRNQKAVTLSGGEQQRVALARALVTKPRMVLLDEPLSALDEGLKEEARNLILELSEEFHVPFIFVTHDLRDARAMSRSLLLLRHGALLASGPTHEILNRPPNLEAARAIAENQILNVSVSENKILLAGHEIQVKEQPHSSESGSVDVTSTAALVAKAWSFQAIAKTAGRLTGTVRRGADEGLFWKGQILLPDGQTITAWSQIKFEVHSQASVVPAPETLLLF